MYFGRGKNKIQGRLTEVDMYNDYQRKIDTDGPYDISKDLYKKILALYYKGLMDYMLLEGGIVKLSNRLGYMAITKKKLHLGNKKYNSYLNVDWKETLKHGKVISHLNEHTRGFKYLFTWSKQTATTNNRAYYRFVPTRTNKRKLAALLKSGDYDYAEKIIIKQ
jgi:hypothetical protein